MLTLLSLAHTMLRSTISTASSIFSRRWIELLHVRMQTLNIIWSLLSWIDHGTERGIKTSILSILAHTLAEARTTGRSWLELAEN
jgi:hypothetical protein